MLRLETFYEAIGETGKQATVGRNTPITNLFRRHNTVGAVFQGSACP